MTVWTEMDSPMGALRLVSDGEVLTAVMFDPPAETPGERDDAHPLLTAASSQLGGYFAGDLKEFDLPISAAGTPFQQRVWQALREIDYGVTWTYGETARWLGLPVASARSVGRAVGRNPIPVVVPCHRVIGSNGSLVGYAGGLDRKQTLLTLESAALF